MDLVNCFDFEEMSDEFWGWTDMKRVNRMIDNSAPAIDDSMPEHWVVRQSKSRGGRTYYFNTITGLSSWKRPWKTSDENIKSPSVRQNSETSSRASVGDLVPPVAKKKKTGVNEHSRDSATEFTNKKKVCSQNGLKSNENKGKGQPSFPSAGQQPGDMPLGSPTKVNRIFSWVSHVNNSYQPTEQGSVLSTGCGNSDFDFPNSYVDDVVIQVKPQIPDSSGSTKRSHNYRKTRNTHQNKVEDGNSDTLLGRQRKGTADRGSVGNKQAASTSVGPINEPRSEPSKEQQRKSWTQPTLHIPPTFCDNNEQQGDSDSLLGQRKDKAGHGELQSKAAAMMPAGPRSEPKAHSPKKQQSKSWTRPMLRIPKKFCDNDAQQNQVSAPITPFSPVSPDPPPVVGTHSRQVPSPLDNRPLHFTPQPPPVIHSVPMAVDSEVPTRTVDPCFTRSISSNACTSTSPRFCATTPDLPESTQSIHEVSSNFHNISGSPIASFPVCDSTVHNSAVNVTVTPSLRSDTLKFSNGPVNTATDGATSQNCEIGMDIDDQELEAQIRVELQEIRSSLVIDASKVQAQAEGTTHQPCSYSDTLYIVLDTNVLLSHLKFVTELRDYPIQGTGRPTLIVPWIVMQELDSLKSDAWKIRQGKIVSSQNKSGQIGIDTLARQAIRYLHSCLEINHPRVRGQTLVEVSELMGSFPAECNDDQILQCCLLFQRKAQSGSAVLFSNDQNLCSKAMINGIRAFNHQTLTSGLKNMFHNNAVVLKQSSFKEYNEELALQQKLADKRAKADDIVCELQCVLREGLSVAVEAEMRAAYDDLWEDIVCIKPPWTLKDLLQLLDKHWIAVFGQVLKRNIKSTVEDLKKSFNVGKGNPGCLANSSIILEQARKLFDAFSARSSYNEAITKCMAAVVVLQRKCQEYQLEPSTPPGPVVTARTPALAGPPPPATPSYNGESNSGGSDENQDVHSVASADINTTNVPQPHEVVLSTFEMIWSAVKQFSDQIFAALDYRPHTRLLENVPKPTPEQAIQFLGRLCPCLACLVTALQSVLKIPVEKGIEDLQPFEDLLHAVARFLEEIISSQSKVVVEDLCRFWQDQDTRISLIQGLCQLDRALAMLQHCASLVATS